MILLLQPVWHLRHLYHGLQSLSNVLVCRIIGLLGDSKGLSHFWVLLGVLEELVNEFLVLSLLRHDLFNFVDTGHRVLLFRGSGSSFLLSSLVELLVFLEIRLDLSQAVSIFMLRLLIKQVPDFAFKRLLDGATFEQITRLLVQAFQPLICLFFLLFKVCFHLGEFLLTLL